MLNANRCHHGFGAARNSAAHVLRRAATRTAQDPWCELPSAWLLARRENRLKTRRHLGLAHCLHCQAIADVVELRIIGTEHFPVTANQQ